MLCRFAKSWKLWKQLGLMSSRIFCWPYWNTSFRAGKFILLPNVSDDRQLPAASRPETNHDENSG
jgi:hypothetical protein